jgi:hypothetical protein
VCGFARVCVGVFLSGCVLCVSGCDCVLVVLCVVVYVALCV